MTILSFGAAGREPLLTKAQLARQLGFCIRWVDYRVAEGMPCVPARGQKRFYLSQVLVWLHERG